MLPGVVCFGFYDSCGALQRGLDSSDKGAIFARIWSRVGSCLRCNGFSCAITTSSLFNPAGDDLVKRAWVGATFGNVVHRP